MLINYMTYINTWKPKNDYTFLGLKKKVKDKNKKMADTNNIDEESELLQFRDPNQPNLHVVYWTRPSAPPSETNVVTNVLFWNHGMGEHSGRVKRIASRLFQTCPSLDVMMSFDMRGHGKSEGTRGASTGFDQYADDAILLLPQMAARYPSARVIIAGHSLGGPIVFGIGMQKEDILKAEEFGEICGFFYSAPAFKIAVRGFSNRVLAPVAPLLATIPFMCRLTKTNGINLDDITHDAAALEEYDKDELVHNQASIGVGADLLTYGERTLRALKQADCEALILQPHVATLIIHSPDDRITECEGSRMFIDAIKQQRQSHGQSSDNVSLVEIKEAKHEIFNETPEFGQDKFYETLSAFVTKVFTAPFSKQENGSET